jgi:hypothetical protein
MADLMVAGTESSLIRGLWPRVASPFRRLWVTWSTAGPYIVPDRAEWSLGLRRLRVAGLTFLLVELLAFGWWSTHVVNSYALTWDFSINLQAVYQISQFHWAAHLSTFHHGVSFYQIHGAFGEFVLGMIYHFWHSPLVLLWAQDIFIVTAQVVAFVFIVEYLARHEQRHEHTRGVILGLLGLALLVFDPWILWTVSFDYHSEPVAVCMVVLTIRSLVKGQRRGFFLLACTMASGDIAATYLAGAGISLVAISKTYWKRGVLVLAAGVATTLLLAHFHFDKGSPTSAFNYLIGPHGIPSTTKPSPIKLVTSLLERPWRPIGVLWSRHVNIVANIAPAGILGYFTPWTIGIPTLSLVLNALPFQFKNEFIVPFFQSLPDYIIIPFGTVWWLAWLTTAASKRWRRVGWALAMVVVVNLAGWAVTWDKTTQSHWLPVSPAAAAELRQIGKAIPLNDEVICSQGVMGLMAARPWIYPLNNGRTFPQSTPTHTTWVVVAPESGIELQSSIKAQQVITRMSEDPYATMVFDHAGVYAFRLNVPPTTQSLVLSHGPKLAWVDPGKAGIPVTIGPEQDWYLESNGTQGYVMAYDYFREPAGYYRAVVKLRTTTPINLEVWDNSTETMLARKSLSPTNSVVTIREHFQLTNVVGDHPYWGFGPWVIHPTPGPTGDQLEVRAYTDSGQGVYIYAVTISKSKSFLH